MGLSKATVRVVTGRTEDTESGQGTVIPGGHRTRGVLPDIAREDVRVERDTVVVVLAAPEGDLPIEQLQMDLSEGLGRDVTLDLRRVPRQRVVIEG